MSAALLQIDDLHLSVPGPQRVERPLLRGVDLTVEAGEAVGLVGESGSGKSMTARAVLRLLPDRATTTGHVCFRGQDVLTMSRRDLHELRTEHVSMVFQDPRGTVNPVRPVGDFLREGLVDRGLSRERADHILVAILQEIGVDRPEVRMRQRPFELSGGLLQRVVIAAALAVEPALILADEPTTALDVTTQEEVLAILDEQRRRRSLALLLITHDLELAAAVCDRIAVMYAGEIVEVIAAREMHSRARHPYTRALLSARPGAAPPGQLLTTVPGRPQSAYDAPATCVFADRCPRVRAICREQRPPTLLHDGDLVRCHFPEPAP